MVMYNDFINEEREFSRKFLKSNQINEDRFDENEYPIIKILFKDTKKVNKIFEIIDDLVKEKDLE
jgi:hypothetical protein